VPHIRLPSIATGVQAFIWAIVFAIYTWAFMLGVGVSQAVSGIVGALTGAAVFLLVRLYGEDLTRTRRARRVKP
jgi:Na+-driven multidrug efflux pump